MSSQLTAYIALTCTSGVLNLYLCIYAFIKRHNYTNIANFFICYTATIIIYCFSSVFVLLSTTVEQIMLWTTFQYIGIAFSPPLGLLFIMKYVGMNITKPKKIALLTIPSLTILMVATNGLHHFHYRVFEIDPALGAPFIHQEIGVWYTIHGIFIFSCMFGAFLLALSRWKETGNVYRPQLMTLMFSQLVPILTAFLYLMGFTPKGIDPVPMMLWLSSLLYLWSISSSRLFTLMPIAKDAIFNSIDDGVMVLDTSLRLIEFNQACKDMFPLLNKTMFGMTFSKVWLTLTEDTFPYSLENTTFIKEIPLGTGNSKRIYQIRISTLQHVHHSKGLLIIFTDITELKMLQQQLEHQAYYDELTQIYNRRAFFQQCEQDFAAAKKYISPFTIILLDIDYFKRVNDTYGHHAGDQLIVHVVKACQTQLEEGALFARYGGEEFVLALKGYNGLQGEAVANQIRKYVESQSCMTEEGKINVTLSLGVAEASHETDETLYQLLNKADQALYAAKAAGRNRVHVYEANEEVLSN
ncbi:diguanylate cyclase [Lysinibacillus sp. LZ02]|uniref:histidine kinase N-terminal 7TM domain-containing diguanylate cyclase n=1 Tax=Lysinibacillus sp. LZ02 TaxID=3420668 RepID=UPI003D35DD08